MGVNSLFTLKNREHEDWPEASLLEPIYQISSEANTKPFVSLYDEAFETWWQNCELNKWNFNGQDVNLNQFLCDILEQFSLMKLYLLI